MSTVAANGSLLVTFVDSGDTNIHGRWANDGSQRVTVTNATSSSPNGTTTNDDAVAGRVGELITAQVVVGSAVPLTSSTATNITSVSLTAGDWDLTGLIGFAPADTTNVTYAEASISNTSATRNTTLGNLIGEGYTASGSVIGTNGLLWPLPLVRRSLAATTTVYLIGYASFSISTLGAYGLLRARRVR